MFLVYTDVQVSEVGSKPAFTSAAVRLSSADVEIEAVDELQSWPRRVRRADVDRRVCSEAREA